MNVRDTDE
jgi:hypothetical protein